MTMTRISPTEAGVAVGDFFVCSWGYDQTNIDFYKVVGLTAKGVKVQAWTSKVVGEGHGYQDRVEPGDSPKQVADWSAVTPEMDHWERQDAIVMRDVEVEQKYLTMYGDTPWFSVNSYSSAKKWHGEAEYKTASGFGH